MKKILLIISAIVFISGCASTFEAKGGKTGTEQKISSDIIFPEYTGEKTRIAVFPIALTQKTIADFPEFTKELRKKSVGFSLWNRITEALYDTKRFTFVEISEEIVKQIIEQWWLGKSGMADPAAVLEMGGIKQAENFIYGEITGFGADTVDEQKGLMSKKITIYSIGVHLRHVNGETLEFIPATGTGKSDSIEKATELAIRDAVLKLLQRM